MHREGEGLMLMIYQCFSKVRIGQQGPGFLMREEPLPDSLLPKSPAQSSHPHFQKEHCPFPELLCLSALLISLNPNMSSCLEYEAISYSCCIWQRALNKKKSPLLVLFNSYILIVS